MHILQTRTSFARQPDITHANLQNFADALRCAKHTECLETLALGVQVHLKLDRLDLARYVGLLQNSF